MARSLDRVCCKARSGCHGVVVRDKWRCHHTPCSAFSRSRVQVRARASCKILAGDASPARRAGALARQPLVGRRAVLERAALLTSLPCTRAVRPLGALCGRSTSSNAASRARHTKLCPLLFPLVLAVTAPCRRVRGLCSGVCNECVRTCDVVGSICLPCMVSV